MRIVPKRRRDEGGVSVTAIEAVYVPADDFTDPAVTTIAAHIDSMVVLSRQRPPKVCTRRSDPIASSSVLLDPLDVGEEHVAVATEVRRNIEHYRELQDVISLLGIEELGAEDAALSSGRGVCSAFSRSHSP